MHVHVGEHEGGAARGEQELVQVDLVAVARADAHHLAVVLVEHDALAEADADRRRALPPRQHGAALVALGAEVGDLGVRRGSARPHHLACVVEDHRAVEPGTALGRDEHVPGVDLRFALEYPDLRHSEVRPGAEALHGPAGALGGAGRRRRGGTRDPEAVVAVLGAGHDQIGRDLDLLAGLERVIGEEARALPVEVRLEPAGVAAALGARHLDRAEAVGGQPAQRDLRLRRRPSPAGNGGDGHRVGGPGRSLIAPEDEHERHGDSHGGQPGHRRGDAAARHR